MTGFMQKLLTAVQHDVMFNELQKAYAGMWSIGGTMVETAANCPACGESGLSLDVNEATHDVGMLDIVAGCPYCGWMGNSFIYVSEMDVLNEGN